MCHVIFAHAAVGGERNVRPGPATTLRLDPVEHLLFHPCPRTCGAICRSKSSTPPESPAASLGGENRKAQQVTPFVLPKAEGLTEVMADAVQEEAPDKVAYVPTAVADLGPRRNQQLSHLLLILRTAIGV